MYSFLWFCFRKTRQPSCVQSLGSVFLTEVTQGYSQSYDNISDLFQPHCSWVSLLLFPTNHLLALFCISQAGICVRVLWIHSVDRRTPRTLSLSSSFRSCSQPGAICRPDKDAFPRLLLVHRTKLQLQRKAGLAAPKNTTASKHGQNLN